MKKKIILGLIVIFLLIQFIPTQKNISDDNTYAIWNQYNTPKAVQSKLQSACLDCHSNTSDYPWYFKIQPVAFWMNRHVNEGKHHLNFSEFSTYPIRRQYHKLEECIEMIDEGEMPLSSYTFLGLHPDAKLNSDDKLLINNWARSIMDSMRMNYPTDSFIRQKRG